MPPKLMGLRNKILNLFGYEEGPRKNFNPFPIILIFIFFVFMNFLTMIVDLSEYIENLLFFCLVITGFYLVVRVLIWYYSGDRKIKKKK